MQGTIPRRMSRLSPITTFWVSVMLALSLANGAFAATDDPPPKKKKKSTTSSASKKKAADDDDSDAAATSVKKKSGSSLDLPLPAKVPKSSETAPAPTKEASPEKKSATSEKAGDDAPKTHSTGAKKEAGTDKPDSAEKKASTTEDKPTEKKTEDGTAKREHAPNATVEPDTIAEFAAQSPRIQQLIRDALDLTRLNLTYTFGSADPDNGGMDCSGTMYYLLRAHGFNDVARDSSGQYLWARKSGAFFPVVSKSAESPEFSDLRPGDLMFWTGTYDTQRDVPISHVMLYLGREKGTGKRIMFGASDGRSYNGIQRWGVSVFDFKMPKADPANPEKAKVDFVGYARIPGLRSAVTTAEETVAAESGDTADKASAKPAATDEPAKPRAKSTTANGEAKPASKASTTASRKKKGTTKKSE